MKKLVILRYIIVIIVLLLIGVNIWTNSLKLADSKTYELVTDYVYKYKQIKMEYRISDSYFKDYNIIYQRKNNGDKLVECIKSSQKFKDIMFENCTYSFQDYGDEKRYAKLSEGETRIPVPIFDPYEIDNMWYYVKCTHKAYEFKAGKLYYVESFQLNGQNNYSIKVYFYNDVLSLVSYVIPGDDDLIIYIDDYSPFINEYEFELNLDEYELSDESIFDFENEIEILDNEFENELSYSEGEPIIANVIE